ncbi:dihydroorotase [Jannaschia pagri]|uniref:Dihydroorotase n=1 Tax=Jannaschia pagri TaxID=2829797 RepID=A0ABQ4NMT3_9RHOB|nr:MULTISPECIES: dihydroorotase [unclassified Jannaschia]GIT91854.1 dihydroorotase [Jannaschia sp. AI_61]GIT95688.1 dihydroorotase [Jannaschia sp. AI_62]
METLTIRRPDDWHLHLRDGDMLRLVAPQSHHFARAIIMPNLVPPVVTGAQAAAYRERVITAGFAQPLMTLYLTEATDPADVVAAYKAGVITAVKLYPAGATTNSASGVRDIEAVRPVLAAMEEAGVPLCIHGEVTDREIDIFDREATFVDRTLAPLRNAYPELKITSEHVTTKEAVDFVRENKNIGATITVQHLMANRNDMLAGGMRPHFYCLPILKRSTHQEALREAATSGDPKFFLGTDSAPHPTHAKEATCCAAGCFTAPIALSCLAHVFEEEGALDKLEGFTSLHGPAHYGLEPNEDTVTLTKGAALDLPEEIEAHGQTVTLFDPGHPLHWSVA